MTTIMTKRYVSGTNYNEFLNKPSITHNWFWHLLHNFSPT